MSLLVLCRQEYFANFFLLAAELIVNGEIESAVRLTPTPAASNRMHPWGFCDIGRIECAPIDVFAVFVSNLNRQLMGSGFFECNISQKYGALRWVVRKIYGVNVLGINKVVVFDRIISDDHGCDTSKFCSVSTNREHHCKSKSVLLHFFPSSMLSRR